MFFYKNKLIKSAQINGVVIFSLAVLGAIFLGLILTSINDMKKIEELLESKLPALPSKVFDRNGELITEFYSDEKRDLVTLDMVPDYLVKGLILYEDESFYHHHGFNPIANFRAVLGNLIGRPISGASTLTQQLSRTLFLTNKFSWTRKIKELWIALQLEKKYSKNEILTLYLNHVPLGYGTNGIKTACRFYFDKNVDEITPAESASLISMISNPTLYSIINRPRNNRGKQKLVLKKMVKSGIISALDSDNSFNKFWIDYQSLATSSRGAFYNREDKAPFFSDWVLQEIQKELPNVNPFRDGLTIYTTLDVRWQELATEMLSERIEKQQKIFEDDQVRTFNLIQNAVMDTIDLLSDTYSLFNIKTASGRLSDKVMVDFNKNLNGPLNLTAQLFGLNLVDNVTEIQFNKTEQAKNLMSEVQGAFIVLDNETGQIITMYGGKKFDPNYRFNFAMQSKRQPGSSFKPLIYSAAFDEGIVTPGDVINDRQYIFTFGSENEEEWYKPVNYGEKSYGRVSVRRALRRSLNIPALKVFYTMRENDFKNGIDRAALLLGINSQSEIEKRIPAELSTVLGTCSVSPVEMAGAFSTFANLGKKRIPNAIIEVKDRDGKVIYSPWKELQKYYRENNKKLQIISPGNAFIVTNILKETLSYDGTLSGPRYRIVESGKKWPDVDMAAKTGTTQNWSDAWGIIYSPLVTLVAWVGFKEYGLSLGYEQAADITIAPLCLEFMRQYHLDYKDLRFPVPDTGFAAMKICRESGLKPSPDCAEDSIYYEYFIPGHTPQEECTYCRELKNTTDPASIVFMDFFDKKYSDQVFIKSDNSDDYFKTATDASDDALKVTDADSEKKLLKEFKNFETDQEVDKQLIKTDAFEDNKKKDQNTETSSSTSAPLPETIIQSNAVKTDQTTDKTKN